MTLIELLVATTILAVALNMTASALINTGRVEPQQRETSAALDAARELYERMYAVDGDRLFALYNEDPADDPDGEGTAPGPNVAVAGLVPREGDADGFVGRVEFPTIDGQLREDFADRDLGMPRDLNFDGMIDDLDHSADARILPFRIVVEWLGQNRRERELVVFGQVRVR